MTQHADSIQAPVTDPSGPGEPPETDDPVVLRELLRQAREHLRLRESIEQLMAENVARTESLLVEARAARQHSVGADRTALAVAVADVRTSLQRALGTVERLEALLAHADETPHAAGDTGSRCEPAPAVETDAEPEITGVVPRTIEVLMHQVHTPALARSAQQHLLGIDGVTSAEVRELAEGLLRITVVSSEAITGESLAGWEPARKRVVRTSSDDVLELELEPDDS